MQEAARVRAEQEAEAERELQEKGVQQNRGLLASGKAKRLWRRLHLRSSWTIS